MIAPTASGTESSMSAIKCAGRTFVAGRHAAGKARPDNHLLGTAGATRWPCGAGINIFLARLERSAHGIQQPFSRRPLLQSP
jgi:hypothetical protein